MNKLLVVVTFATILSACAEAPRRTALAEPALPAVSAVAEVQEVAQPSDAGFSGPGAQTAAILGFHGPVERVMARSTD